MKNSTHTFLKKTVFLGLLFITILGCERDISTDVEFATYPSNGDVFIDGFVGGLDYFPFTGSFLEAFSVETEETFQGSASMRFDIPSFGVNYAGATFPSLAPRDLSGFDALTFWAKASQGADINEIGFGIDGNTDNKYQVTVQNLQIATVWTKYIIPIPDASKLIEARGMFWYAEGAENASDEGGYTFWIDELKYEKLGNIAQPRPAIFNGQDIVQTAFLGAPIPVTGLTQTFNLGSGANQTVLAAPSYFTFTSSNTDVALVSELGIVTIVGQGNSVITASINGVPAEGSLTVNSGGSFDLAPTPTRDPNTVISIFSDHYTNVPVDFYNGFWEPFQTTTSADFIASGDNILGYSNFNFVGTQFANPTIDATNMNFLHVDIYIPDGLPSLFDFLISVVDFGPDGVDGGTDDTRQQIFISASDVQADTWVSLDLPITLANRDHLGLIIYENINSATLTDFYLDNVYFYE